MWWKKDPNVIVIRLKEEIESLRNEKRRIIDEALKSATDVKKYKEELEDLKSQKKRELQEVEHLVKMAKEKNAIEYERKVAEVEKLKAAEIFKMQKEYYEKIMVDLQKLTSEILARLPNVNMEITKKVR